jgi:manganese efflux pump family protein
VNYLVIFLTAVGLAMDAFAVAIAAGSGINDARQRTGQALRIGLSFGLFQMVMPIAGWALGTGLKQYITAYDHWVAFGLLSLIGLKMIRDSFDVSVCENPRALMTTRRLLLLSVATSVDALAVGVGFAFLDYPVFLAAAVIGAVTFLISTAGVFIGHFCSCLWGKRAELAGGILLILIGLKILHDHLWG